MSDQTRQYGPIESIRADHVKRYLLAADILQKKKVLDLACGCGYGSWLLHGAGNEVTGVDIAPEAIAYARKHYQGPNYQIQSAYAVRGSFDALVSFETIEHLEDPLKVLRAIEASVVLASVPNADRYPFIKEKFAGDEYPHLRHYTPKEFDELFEAAGFTVKKRLCQPDKQGEIVEGTDGRFLIYACEKGVGW